eukprot:361782-Chlamydomonas_euryale.AAC.2
MALLSTRRWQGGRRARGGQRRRRLTAPAAQSRRARRPSDARRRGRRKQPGSEGGEGTRGADLRLPAHLNLGAASADSFGRAKASWNNATQQDAQHNTLELKPFGLVTTHFRIHIGWTPDPGFGSWTPKPMPATARLRPSMLTSIAVARGSDGRSMQLSVCLWPTQNRNRNSEPAISGLHAF